MRFSAFPFTSGLVPSGFLYFLLVCGSFAATSSAASELVYTPVNPNFGGSPLNGNSLLAGAQATTKHQDPRASASSGYVEQSPLDQFNDSLERSVLSQLATAATSSVIVGGRIVPGTVQTGNFVINISDIGGGLLQITTTDKVTGASTTFKVNSL